MQSGGGGIQLRQQQQQGSHMQGTACVLAAHTRAWWRQSAEHSALVMPAAASTVASSWWQHLQASASLHQFQSGRVEQWRDGSSTQMLSPSSSPHWLAKHFLAVVVVGVTGDLQGPFGASQAHIYTSTPHTADSGFTSFCCVFLSPPLLLHHTNRWRSRPRAARARARSKLLLRLLAPSQPTAEMGAVVGYK